MTLDRPSKRSDRPDGNRYPGQVPRLRITRPADGHRPASEKPAGGDVPGQLRAEIDKLYDMQRRGATYGPARLQVGAASGGGVRVSGWISPARIVHATRSRDVIVGNGCEVKRTEHHRFDRVRVTMQGVLGDRAVRAALRALVLKGFSTSRDDDLVAALRSTLPAQAGPGPTADLPLAEQYGSVVTWSGVVQIGDGSTLRTEVPISVRETVLPGAELLIAHAGLRRSFVAAIQEEQPAGPAMLSFLGALLTAAESTDDLLSVLDHAAASHVHDASVFGLFGFAQVCGAGVVLAGAGNTLTQDAQVDVREFRSDDVASVVAGLRRDFGLDGAPPPTGPGLRGLPPFTPKGSRSALDDPRYPIPRSAPGSPAGSRSALDDPRYPIPRSAPGSPAGSRSALDDPGYPVTRNRSTPAPTPPIGPPDPRDPRTAKARRPPRRGLAASPSRADALGSDVSGDPREDSVADLRSSDDV